MNTPIVDSKEMNAHDFVVNIKVVDAKSARQLERDRARLLEAVNHCRYGILCPVSGIPEAECLVAALDEAISSLEIRQPDYPECSGNPADCPENEGYGCCKNNHASLEIKEQA